MKSMEHHPGGAVREKRETGEDLHERVKAFQGDAHRMSRVMSRFLDAYTPDASAKTLSTVLRRSQLRADYAAIGRPLLLLAKAFETTTQLWDEGASKTLASLEDAAASLENFSEVDLQPLLIQFEGKAKDIAAAMRTHLEHIARQIRTPLSTEELPKKLEELHEMEGVADELRLDLPVVSNLREHLMKFAGEAKALRDVLIDEINQRREREAA